TSARVLDQAEEEIAALIRERHHIRPGTPDDFNLRHPTEIAEAVKQSTQTMEALLAAVASVSLIVGGIGIMNIMLVSVTERTRETLAPIHAKRPTMRSTARAIASSRRSSVDLAWRESVTEAM